MSSSTAPTASSISARINAYISNTCDLCDLHLHDSSGSFRVLVADEDGIVVLPTPP